MQTLLIDGAVIIRRYLLQPPLKILQKSFIRRGAGQLDLCREFSQQPDAIVALTPIIGQAGGVITTLSGKRPEAGGHTHSCMYRRYAG